VLHAGGDENRLGLWGLRRSCRLDLADVSLIVRADDDAESIERQPVLWEPSVFLRIPRSIRMKWIPTGNDCTKCLSPASLITFVKRPVCPLLPAQDAFNLPEDIEN